MKMKIGIMGVGFVGGTTAKVLEREHEIFLYDRYKAPNNTSESIETLAKYAEVVFICVPTPMKPSGEIDYSPMHHSLKLLADTAKKVERYPSEILVTVT